MKKILIYLLIIFTAFLKSGVKAEVYGSISGKVIEKNTKNGIEDISVSITGIKSQRTVTDKDGNYVFRDLVPGNYELVIDPYMLSFFEKVQNKKSNLAVYKSDISNWKKEIVIKSIKNIMDMNFYLETEAAISGEIYQSEGTVPLCNGLVYAYNTSDDVYDSSKFVMFVSLLTDEHCGFTLTIPASKDWHLFYIGGPKGNKTVYEYDSLINVRYGENVENMKIVLDTNVIDSTKIFGRIKDSNGNYLNGKSKDVEMRNVLSDNWFVLESDFNAEGFYSVQGDILPGEYEVIIGSIEYPDTTSRKNEFNRYDAGKFIINRGEQKELDFIYDRSKAKRDENYK